MPPTKKKTAPVAVKNPPVANDDDEDFFDEETAYDIVSGAVTGTDANAAGDLLLDISAALLRAAVYLSEADEDDWKAFGPRLATMRSVFAQLPTEPKKRRSIGFRMAPPPVKKARR